MPPAHATRTKMPEMPVLARLRGLAQPAAWWRWQISGRGLTQPHCVSHVLSSEHTLKAIQTLVLRPFLVTAGQGGKVW